MNHYESSEDEVNGETDTEQVEQDHVCDYEIWPLRFSPEAENDHSGTYTDYNDDAEDNKDECV